MKRFFKIVAAAAFFSTAAFSNSASAAWGSGNWGTPVGPPVGQSSRPSTHPASAPINTPFNPNANHGHVPGSFQDKAAKGQLGNGPSSNMGYNPNKPIYTKPTNSGVFLPPSQRPSRERPSTSGYGNNSYPQQLPQYPMGGYGNNSYPKQTGNHGGYFGNDVLSRPTNYPQPNYPQKPSPSRPSNYPPAQPQYHYPSGNVGHAGTQYPSNGGYGGGSVSQYGMFVR